MQDTHVGLAHGNGGRYMRELIQHIFVRHLGNPELDADADAVPVDCGAGDIMLTTDAFTVQPLEFPGGNIGSLAVHGIVNDLAVSGATPLYLTLAAIIEEGLAVAQLERIVAALGEAARRAAVRVVAGDTKVVRRGEAAGLYLSGCGVGVRARRQQLGMDTIRAGDALLVSGPVGDHGVAVLLAREEFGLMGQVESDCASVLPLTQALLAIPGLRFMRDPTRGGLATVLHEISRASGLGVELAQPAIPLRPAVQSVCEMLGYDPLYLACEGRVVAVVDADDAPRALQALRALPAGAQAALIGSTTTAHTRVVLSTALGGERCLEELEDDPLPRIC
ncbi:MAG TPA: hydrogenase expression/formation protein HypE [Steroidobacteraceae bacterium]|nr:hydrogenase expression/formation protein HypE [Steroidobacteraceae bacterium]